MLLFQDEFEYESNNGEMYNVEVSGYPLDETTLDIKNINIYDSLGNIIDEDEIVYSEILEEAQSKEYQFEIHSANFDYYNMHLND